MNPLLQKLMFIDIETVPSTEKYTELNGEMQHLWDEKFNLLRKRMPEKYPEDSTPAFGYETSAGIYAEFGRIICISVGFIFIKNEEMHFRTKSFADEDEARVLRDFSALIEKYPDYNFCGHNIKEFDIPYICRRMLINNLPLPIQLQINNRKPWEVNLVDTLDYWKFGDYKNFTSLKLLTAVFGIPSPKDDIDGSLVAEVFYGEKNLPRIATYCQKDVLATAQIWLRMNGNPIIKSENIQHT
ncbi:MAG TPA: 3'-5' exonuclease [Paludibacteraceae bacterium]|nr:3'-5' exonuclease [Paludibacteraceae bacterium]